MLNRGKPSAWGATSILPFTLVSPSSLLTPRATPLTSSVESPPPFISPQCFHPYTGKLIYFLPPDTPAEFAYSFAFVRSRKNGRGKQRNGNERFGAAEKGQLWLKPFPFSSSTRFTCTWILAIFPKETPTTSVLFKHPLGIFVAKQAIRKLYDFASLCGQRGRERTLNKH